MTDLNQGTFPAQPEKILLPQFDRDGESVEFSTQNEGVVAGIPEATITSESVKTSRSEKIRKTLAVGSLALFALGGAVTLAENPLGDLKNDVVESAPWALTAGIATEVMWVGGAALMLTGAGIKIGDPRKIHSRAKAVGLWSGTNESISSSMTYKTGLRINTIGAVSLAGVIAGGAITALPPETWPGALGFAAMDIAGTAALRAPLYKGVRKVAAAEKETKVTVRKAQLEDIDRLADIDLELFDQAYGEALPNKQDVVEMLTSRWENAKGWMFVAEQNGQVEGFVTAFRTNKSSEDFESWEDSTANGTLEGKVDPKGKYVYVANMTIKHEAVVQGAKDMLLANLFANAIHEGGVEYGYWESRMPQFKEWLDATGREAASDEELDQLAHEYSQLTREDGKRYDWQLRMYESDGFKLKNLVANAFNDQASMNYGAVFYVPCPPKPDILKRIAPIRKSYAVALRAIAKNPKLLAKVV